MPKISVNGASLHYEEFGRGFPIVFTHGLGLDKSMWLNQVPIFAARYRVITWDIRGHGCSEVTEDGYSISQLVEDLEELLFLLGVEKAYIVGLSLGGWISWKFAAKNPHKTEALILSDSAGYLKGMTQTELDEKKQIFDAGAEICEKHGRVPLADPTIDLMFSKEFIENNDHIVNALKSLIEKDPGLGYARTIKQALGDYWGPPGEDVEKELASIKAPTMILAGDLDVITPLVTQQAINKQIKGSRLEVLKGAGHLACMEQPEIWNSLVLEFFNG